MLIWLLAAAALLALPPLATLAVARAAERRHPPVGERIGAGSGAVHVVRRGSGAPVVLIHGATGNLRDWTASIFDDVAARHQAIALDRPGHGWSDRIRSGSEDPRVQADILHRVLRRMGAERPILVGHSFGAAVALAHALDHPDDTGGVLFLAGVAYPWPGGHGVLHALGAHPVVGPLLARTLLGPGFALLADTAVRRAFAPNRPPAGYRQATALALYARPASFAATARDVAALKAHVAAMAPRYAGIGVPVIALTGDSDRVVDPRLHARRLAAEIPGAELRVLAGVGHLPHHIVPGAVKDAIDDLVARRLTAFAEGPTPPGSRARA